MRWMILFLFALSVVPLHAQSWTDVQGGIKLTGYEAEVYQLLSDSSNNYLYTIGLFDTAGDIHASNLATWNGNEWAPYAWADIGEGNLIIYNGQLYKYGLYGVAKWNGINWTFVSGTIDNSPLCAIVYNNQLIVGGYFTQIGNNITVNGIAAWDGVNWNALGNGLTDTIPPIAFGEALSLCIYNDDLIVGGNFDKAGNVHARNIAQWNGTNWNALSTGVSNLSIFDAPVVRNLVTYENLLFAAGGFDSAGGVFTNQLAKWDGIEWDSVDNHWSSNHVTKCFLNVDDTLFVGTEDDTLIWAYTNNQFYPLVTNCQGKAYTLAYFQNHLYVGGDFEMAIANDTIRDIAERNGPLGINELSNESNLIVYPNPATEDLHIKTNVPQSELIILNSVGQTFIRLQAKQEETIDVSSLAAGLYFLEVKTKDGIAVKKFVKE